MVHHLPIGPLPCSCRLWHEWSVPRPRLGAPTFALLAAIALGSAAIGAVARPAHAHGGTATNIYTIDVTTHRLMQLTHNREMDEDQLAYSPSFSSSGTRFAYAETRCHACESFVHVAVRGAKRWLGRTLAAGFSPHWAPRKDIVAYVGTDGSLYTVRASGGGRRLLVRGGLANADPDWSPDGRRLAFARQLTAATWQLQVVDARGGAPTALTASSGQAVEPAWAHDGLRLAFTMREADGRWQIYVVDTTTLRTRKLSDGKSSDSAPAWSPDDRTIAFVREQGLDGSAVFTMPSTGGRPRRLTPRSLAAVQPEWAPRGQLVVFAAQVRGE